LVLIFIIKVSISIKYAINLTIPKEKIIVGIPFYGRFWKSGNNVGGDGITMNDVHFLLNNYSSSTNFNNYYKSANAIVTINVNDPKPKVWGGQTLSQGTYNIWYDDLQSIENKLNLINKYNVYGVGIWALGQENISVWDIFEKTLDTKNANFSIKNKSFNFSLKKSNYNKVITNLTRILFENYNQIFNLNHTLNKEEVTIIIADYANICNSKTFNANVEDKYSILVRNGVIDNKNKNNKITRAQLAVILDYILNIPETIDFHAINFDDVKYTDSEYYSISKLCYYNIMNAAEKNNFNMDGFVTIKDFAIILDKINYNNFVIDVNKVKNEKNFGKQIIFPTKR
jgi:spore germination protein YaaH